MGMIATTSHRVQNAWRFYSNSEIWAILGGQDPWPDENNPTDPDVAEDEINTPIGAKLATLKIVIRDDVLGTEQFILPGEGITRWRVLTTLNDALAEGARWVLIRAIIIGDELPLTTFREIGFVSDLTKDPGAPGGATELLPAEISDYGILEAVEYKQPVTRDISTGYEVAAIIEL